MSTADLPRGISANWDPIRRLWLIAVPLDVIEDEMHRQGKRFTGPAPSYDDMVLSGKLLGAELAKVIAAPGPIQREVRARVARNNRRRFGP